MSGGRPVRLVCAPHAGGGSVFYRSWQDALGPSVELVVLVRPGCEHRRREHPVRTMAEVVELALEEHDFDGDYALFGHSLGAAVAYELCAALLERGHGPPVRLFVSGRRPPHVPPRHTPAHALPRDAFVERLVQLNGVPSEILEQQDVLDLYLDLLRADFQVNETYGPPVVQALPVPITALTGDRDPAVTFPEMLRWREATTGPFRMRVLPGDHFYLRGPPEAVTSAILTDLVVA